MTRFLLALAAMIGFASAAAAQDAAVGIWQTEPDDGSFAHIVMQPCGSAVCGTIQRTFYEDGTEYDSPNKGLQIVIDMVPNGDGTYNGQVFRPSNSKTYIGKMQVNGNNLRLQGCVAGGLLCASQNWVRAG